MTRYRRNRPQRRRKPLMLVATEGERTEKLYLEALRTVHPPQTYQVHVLHARNGDSSPSRVLKTMLKGIQKYGAKPGDSLWLVIDRDEWDGEELSRVTSESKRRKITVALSNPCFELWLVLHQDRHRSPLTSKECSRLVKADLGTYDKGGYDARRVLQGLERAITRAKIGDSTTDDVPTAPTTRMYQLVEAILSDIPAP